MFFSWWCKIELDGYIMVVNCSLGLPNWDLACVLMPVKGCFKHKKRPISWLKTHTIRKSYHQTLHHIMYLGYTHSNTVCKRKWFENSLNRKNWSGYCSDTEYMRFYWKAGFQQGLGSFHCGFHSIRGFNLFQLVTHLEQPLMTHWGASDLLCIFSSTHQPGLLPEHLSAVCLPHITTHVHAFI